jgi:hypothetical protein
MRRAITKGVCLLGTCCLLALSFPVVAGAGTPNGGDIPRCVAMLKSTTTAPATKAVPFQVYNDGRTHATFFFASTGDGAVQMTVKASELDVEKTVYPDGRSRIVLRAGDDLLAVAVSAGIVEVERSNGHRLRVDVFGAADDEWVQVKVLLAGSKALRLFRALAGSLDPRTSNTPAGAAVALSDAALAQLDGDSAAVGRLVQQMRAARQARIRPVRFAIGEADCWHTYEGEVMHAADDYDSCRHTFSWYDPRQAACAFVWTIQAESAWGELLACSSIGVKIQ